MTAYILSSLFKEIINQLLGILSLKYLIKSLLYNLKMTFCHSCDKIISQSFIKKHNKSKSHLYFYNNFLINKY